MTSGRTCQSCCHVSSASLLKLSAAATTTRYSCLHFLLLLHPLCLLTVLSWLLIGLALLAHSPSCPVSMPPHCFVMASHWPCIACTFSFLSMLCASPLFCYGFSLALHRLHILLLVHALCLPTELLWLLIGLASLGCYTFSCFSIVCACQLFVLVSASPCIAWSLRCLSASSSLSLNSEMMYLDWYSADVTT